MACLPQIVIAGLDPAIQKNLMNAAIFARLLDCRVKPGNDTVEEAGLSVLTAQADCATSAPARGHPIDQAIGG